MLWFTISVVSAVFLNTLLAPALGFEAVTTVAFLPMILLILKDTLLGKINYSLSSNRPALNILIISIVILFIKSVLGQDYFKNILTFFVMPALMSLLFENSSKAKLNILKVVVLIFYISECILALYERLIFDHVFLLEIDKNDFESPESWQFRSQAFLGHPLANAMVVAVLMSFIVTNNQMKIKNKSMLILFGHIALFCFNARGAIIVSIGVILPYLFYLLYNSVRKKYIIFYIYIFIVLICGISYTIYDTDLGGRLIKGDELLDGSAMSRLDVFRFYLFVEDQDLLWGNPDNYMNVTSKLKAGGVENGFIVLLLQYGILLSIPALLLMFNFQFIKLKIYKGIKRNLILIVFYVIGAMNPNLGSPIQWTMFVFGYYAFVFYKIEMNNMVKLKENIDTFY